MIALVTRLRDSVRGSGRDPGPWAESCEAGAPVPRGIDGCRGVDCHTVHLTELATGDGGTVSCLDEPWTAEAATLASLGVLPGVRIRMVQRYPAYVVALGRARVAMDESLAGRVRVRVERPVS